MLEIIAVAVTVGAMLYRMGGLSILTIGYCGLVLAVVVMFVVRSRKGIVLGLVLGAALSLGALALWRIDEPIDQAVFGNRAFDARVVSVDRRLEKTNSIVRDREQGKKLQLTTREQVQFLPGDIVTVRGEVKRPEDFVTQTGRVFEYERYLESKGIVGLIQNPIIGPGIGHTFSIARVPTRIRDFVAHVFSVYVSFPFDGVLAGMLVGYQGGLPQSIQDLFRNTGVLHVLVLSGYNITLLAGFLAIFLKHLPFRMRNLITVIAIVLIVLVSGAGIASIRAGIMGSIAVFAGLSIRTYQPLRALTVSYLFFFFLSPTTIFVDPGFHLSFLATFFMIVMLPKVEKLFCFIPQTKYVDLRELIVLAVATPIFMLPYMMYFSGLFPLSSPIANILFALVTPLVMVLGIILVACAWITPVATFLGLVISGLGSLVLAFLTWCNTFYIWNTPSISWWGVSAMYMFVFVVVFRRELIQYVSQLYRTLRQQSNAYPSESQ